ncbi:MAP3K12-binding inhibitory protein 1-like [Oculina patagonica]
MEQENILVEILRLIEGFLQKLSLPADVVKLTFSCEELLKTEVNESAVLGHLSQLVEDIKLIQGKCTKVEKLETTDTALMSPAAKKMKLDDKQEDNSASHNVQELDTSLIQVKADKTEIDRRISAFIQRKRIEVDLLNKREFCNVIDTENNNEFRCARTDAVFVRRLGQKSHIKVTQVENTSTSSEAQALGPDISKQTTLPSRLEARSCPGIEERLRNMEAHLGYGPGRPVPCDVYERLADLEEKILHLEGLSPEYFRQNNLGHGRLSSSGDLTDSSQNLTLDAIDERIRTLRHSLSKGFAS